MRQSLLCVGEWLNSMTSAPVRSERPSEWDGQARVGREEVLTTSCVPS